MAKTKSTAQPKKGRAESRDSASVHKGLNPKQARFVDEYMIDLNATQAATRAGYSAKTANEQGARLLANVSVREEIAKRQSELRESSLASAARTLSLIARIIERGHEIAESPDLKMSDVLKAVEIQNDMLGYKNGGAADDTDAKRTEDLRWVSEKGGDHVGA